jgi:hypothetical protein
MKAVLRPLSEQILRRLTYNWRIFHEQARNLVPGLRHLLKVAALATPHGFPGAHRPWGRRKDWLMWKNPECENAHPFYGQGPRREDSA